MNCCGKARELLEAWLVLRACCGELPPKKQASEDSQIAAQLGGDPAPLLSCVMKGGQAPSLLDSIWSRQDVITNRDLKAMG